MPSEDLPENAQTDAGSAVPPSVPDPAPAPALPTPVIPVSVIPDTAAGAMPLPRWSVADYAVFATGDSAQKLSDSAVAPLVAAARGYRHIGVADKDTARLTGATLTGAVGSRFKKLVGTNGALFMPWFRPSVARREITGARPGASATQFRPVDPLFNERSGKFAKYEFLANMPTVLDVHPATPGNWLEYTPTVVITEGCLKGDAGLTGMLRAAGIPDAALRYDDDTVDALAVLRALLKKVPEADRVMILSFGGVGNWHQHPEWSDMNFKGRTVLIAFDGDLDSNADVHRQGTALWTKLQHLGATPKRLDLNVVVDAGRGVETKKVGLDDYLAEIGPWESLADRVLDELPPAPQVDGAEFSAGDWRMNEDTCVSEVLREIKSDGGSTRAIWDPKAKFIGRIARTQSVRNTTDEEVQTGELADVIDADAETTVHVEIQWKQDGETRTATVTGPDTMLADNPQIWASRSGGRIPTDVLTRPDWPPMPEWLRGMKGHREDDIEKSTQWGHMQWVPVEQGTPVFIVGKQVIGRYGDGSKAASPGVTERVLSKSSKFAVICTDDEDQVKAAVKKVWRAYRDGVWTDRRVSALVLAAALRPVVPLPCSSALLLSGGKSLGKSFTAGAVMSFWGTPGAWDNNHLPGSAEDTMAATESALARTPIWVIDDWAPVADARKAAQDSAKLGQIIRATHNHAAKRRSRHDMTSQEVQSPRALLIITAEHEHTVSSVSDRLIHVPITAGSLGTQAATDRLVAIQKDTGEAAMVTGAAIKMLAGGRDWIGAGNWADSHEWWRSALYPLREHAEALMADDTGKKTAQGAKTRHRDMAADLALGLLLWQELFRSLGLKKEMRETHEARAELFSLCRDHLVSQADTTPGGALVRALRATLAAGHAHIDSVDTPGMPPVSNNVSGALLNSQLGWRAAPEGSRGGGESIGVLIYPPKSRPNEDPVILLHHLNAVMTAQRHYPQLIPYGSQPAATWSSAWSEGFCADYWRRKHSPSGRELPIVRTMQHGIPLEGVPIRMSALLDLALSPEDVEDNLQT